MFWQKYINSKRCKGSLEIEDVTQITAEDSDETLAVREPLADKGFRFFQASIVVVFLLLVSRVIYLQVVKGEYYSNLARENRIRYVEIKAPRGLILDRNGKSLVENMPSFDAILIPADLPKNPDEREKSLKEMAIAMDMNDQSLKVITDSQDQNSLKPVLVKENISEEQALIFTEKKNEMAGFQLDKTAVREYENGPSFSSVMGYTGKITSEELRKFPDYLMTDYIGKTGLESSYEKYLRGVKGKQKVEVDSSGNVKKYLGEDNPVKGSDLELGLDADLQMKLKESLEKNLSASGTKAATAVAINPRNGEILAMVNIPGFDNNLFAKGISAEDYQNLISDPEKPMFNRAVSGEYPPGSTLKPVVASAALEEKVINENTTVDCNGGIHIGSYAFPDWKTHGVTDVRKALAESCDVFFYSVGGGWGNITGLGIDNIKKYADHFGLGKILSVDIPGEAPGLIPDQAWKQQKFGEKWYVGDDYHCAIGQGFDTATPLQLANYTAAVANGGTVYRPHFVSSIKNMDGTEEKIQPDVLDRGFVSPSNIEIVREGMRQTITSGSAQQLNDLKVAVAGKTGTAQFGNEGKTHGWFISFAPFDNPEIAMAVLVEGGGEGHSTAVPVTREVYKWYFEERNKK